MKKLGLLLILLLCWNHVCCQFQRCSTGVAMTNQAISLLSSTHAGAKVFLLIKYKTSSLTDCLQECCSGKNGPCSVTEFTNKSTDANCHHYSCQPIMKCKFMEAEGTDSFTFPTARPNVNAKYNPIHSDGNHYDKLKDKALDQGVIILQKTFKDHTRAVTARKGVESFTATSTDGSFPSWEDISTVLVENSASSKSLDTINNHARTVTARKGVSESTTSTTQGSYKVLWRGFSSTPYMENDSLKSSDSVTLQKLLSKTDSSFKNDNTTIKPRKGVDSEVEVIKIKARKGVEMVDSSKSSTSSEVTRSKVKPRKGAVLLPLSVSATPAVSLQSVPELNSASLTSDIRNYSQTLPSNFTLSTDLVSVLEQVFRDESPSPSVNSTFDHSTYAPSVSASNSFTMSSTPVSNMNYNKYTTIPLVKSSLTMYQSSASLVTESPSMPSYTVLPSKTSEYHTKVAESTPPLITITESALPTTASQLDGYTLNPSRTPMLQTSTNTDSSILSDDTSHRPGSEVLLFTISSLNKTKMAVQYTSDDDENERKYKSSMHLVLSLVFGLLVLFVVFGAVAKRVYDVWMRRHYHRMDFLIDGMYDGYS